MPKRNKTIEYSNQHAKERFLERYGKQLSEKNYQKLNKFTKESIEKGEYMSKQLIQHKPNKEYMYVIEIHLSNDFTGLPIIATYETKRDCITTFLPPVQVQKDF